MKRLAPLLLLPVLGACATMDAAIKAAADAAAQKGHLSKAQAESIKKTSTAFRKSAEEISESEEYYIGRAVAAELLSRYEPSSNEPLGRYVRAVGQAVAMASDRPSTFIGYRFQVLDSEEPNAFAAPGGFVFVTTGLLKRVQGEDELAAVLGHEVAHVSLKHGLKTIQTARLSSAFAILATEAGKQYTNEEVAKLAQAFEGAIDDIVTNLVVKGYSRDKEFEADRLGAEFARRAGYDPKALARFLPKLGGGSQGLGLLKTHPGPEARLEKLEGLSTPAGYKPSKARDARFAKAAAGL